MSCTPGQLPLLVYLPRADGTSGRCHSSPGRPRQCHIASLSRWQLLIRCVKAVVTAAHSGVLHSPSLAASCSCTRSPAPWVALLTQPRHPQHPALWHEQCTTPPPVVCCRLHLSSGALFALLADGTIHVWEVATGKDPVLLEVWDHPTPNNRDRVTSCCFMSGADLSPRLADFQGDQLADGTSLLGGSQRGRLGPQAAKLPRYALRAC